MTSPWSCELHENPGACDEECLHIAWSMRGPGPYWDLPYDPTGCNRPRPMPEYQPVLDTINHGVMWIDVHPADCDCGDEEGCPRAVDERSYWVGEEGTAQMWEVVRPDGKTVTVKRYYDGSVVEADRPDQTGGLLLVHSGGGLIYGWPWWDDVIKNTPHPSLIGENA